jgi:Tol biopolymer transport system component
MCDRNAAGRIRWLGIALFLAVLPIPAAADLAAGADLSLEGDEHTNHLQNDAGDGLRFGNPVWSPDGRHLALSDDHGNGVYVYDTEAESILQITDAPSSGYAFNWSPDGRRLGFKLLIPQAGSVFPLQAPVVYSLDQRKLALLCDPTARAGVPSFSSDGLTAFTVDQELRVVNLAGETVATAPLGHYVNLAVISPDGTRVAYNTKDDQVAVLQLDSGKSSRLTAGQDAYFKPVWSPDSRRLAVSTIAARLKCIDLQSRQVHDLDEGTDPSWALDGQTVLYSRTERLDGAKVIDSDIYQIDCDGSGKRRLTWEAGEHEAAARLSPSGQQIAFLSLVTGELYQASVNRNSATHLRDSKPPAYSLNPKVRLNATAATFIKLDATSLPLEIQAASEQPLPIPAANPVTLLGTVPYLHQVYDAPDSFDGDWACGASSAIMAINYFGILPYWDVTCSWPYSHVSHYGRYVSEIYTYNGVTYDYRARDASRQWAYGGYAYIVRNNWADTKGYMRDYIINHGLSSEVDWSPTWAKLQLEVNNDDPCVVLNSLTSAGHYITAIGYYTTQYTAVFNDPYGNKNTPGYPSYDGAGALYDWPGYNNGFQNLNTVHCFIYCRGSMPPIVIQQPSAQSVEWGRDASFLVAAMGEGTLSYQWEKDGVALMGGTHYSGVTSTILTVLNATDQEAGQYRCVVSNVNGSTPSNSATLTVVGPPIAPGDMDRDGDVDQKDFGLFQACLSGTAVLQNEPGCIDAHLDNDSDVDQADVALFFDCLSGPAVQANLDCVTP